MYCPVYNREAKCFQWFPLELIIQQGSCGVSDSDSPHDFVADPYNAEVHRKICDGLRSVVGELGEYLHIGYALADSACFGEYLTWHKVCSVCVLDRRSMHS
jgi:hypothetical protein